MCIVTCGMNKLPNGKFVLKKNRFYKNDFLMKFVHKFGATK